MLTGLTGASLGVALGGRARGWLGPVQVAARAVPAGTAGVRVDIPPAGHATLPIFRGPLRVEVLATDVDPSRAQGLLRMPDDATDAAAVRDQLHTVLDRAGDQARRLGVALAARTVVAALGGAAAAGALTARRRADVGPSPAAAAAALAGVAAIGAATLDRDAWREPQLRGLLDKAPLLLGDLRTAPARLDTYRDQLADLLRTGTGVYRKVAALPEPPPADAVRLLHVSDIHLNPVAFGLAQAMIAEYHVDAVVDTGDLVDWGTPAENAFTGQIGGLGVPYVFVKGNHDSAGIAAAVAEQPNAVVLSAEGGPREVAGVRFAGMADPRFTPDKTTGDDHAAHRVSEAAQAFAAGLRGEHVDVVCVHDPAAGRAIDGVAPLVLAGHTHQRSVRRYGDAVVVVQGTSGGSGLRGVQRDPPDPVSLSVVYLDRATKRLWGVDEVTLGGIGEVGLSVVRKDVATLLATVPA